MTEEQAKSLKAYLDKEWPELTWHVAGPSPDDGDCQVRARAGKTEIAFVSAFMQPKALRAVVWLPFGSEGHQPVPLVTGTEGVSRYPQLTAQAARDRAAMWADALNAITGGSDGDV